MINNVLLHGVLAMYTLIDVDTFRDIQASLNPIRRIREVLELLAKRSTNVLKAKGALVRILNLKTNQFESGAAYGLGEKYLSKPLLYRQEVITELYQLNKIVIIKDILSDPRVLHRQEALDEGIRMMVDVPLALQRQMVGILRVYLSEQRDLSEKELSFLATCAACGACAIQKARMIEEQQAQYDHLALQTEKLSSLGRMAAGIAHEINNPLAGILLYSTNLIKKTPKEGPLREGLEIIIRETARCKTIIQELLEFSREGEPEKTLVNVNKVIEKALSILENEFRLHHIQVEKHLADTVEDILLDANQMEQVLVNLLLNGVEAIQDHGLITVQSRMDAERKHVIVEIADTGCGILPEHLPRIFEPFFSTKPSGTGLGLSVSYGIVQKHRGNIAVSSEPGRGTRFTIELPVPRGIGFPETTNNADRSN